jgi:hypothetical protein
MIRSGNSIRFTPDEVREFRQVGLEVSNVKDQQHLEHELSRWAHLLANERFGLLERVVLQMGKTKGLNVPPKLTIAVRSTSSTARLSTKT